MSFGARAVIRLDALQHNLDILRAAAPEARVMAVIKANAYGHGMVPVARALDGVDALAVARIAEAMELRDAGIKSPINLFSGVFTPDELKLASELDFEVVVHCEEQVQLLDTSLPRPLVVWLKVDTDMNRLGFTPERAAELVDKLKRSGSVLELRLMTHFADADNIEGPLTTRQMERFQTVAAGFDGSVSVANSPAMLGWPDIADARAALGFSGDCWIRPGIALYGISPFAGRSGADLGLEPVMRFEARLIAKKQLRAGCQVGYKGRYTSDADTQLGIIAAGYGDGYSRHFRDGTPVLLNGRRVPLVGNVSMDMIAVDLGPDAEDAVGDIGVLWGDGLPVEEVAPFADAIPYELVCGVMNREVAELVR